MRALSLIALLTLVGCPSTAPVPGVVTAADPQESAVLAQGHRIFSESCGSCHGHPDVTQKTASEWPATVERMGAKADLSADEVRAVTRFVLAARARAVQSTP